MKGTLTETTKILYPRDFECYRSNVCHFLKDSGDVGFPIRILEEDSVTQLAEAGSGAWALYLLAMFDYVSRENGIEPCTKYGWLRGERLPEMYMPNGVLLGMRLFGDRDVFDEAYRNAIPEFLRHNVMEGDVRDAC